MVRKIIFFSFFLSLSFSSLAQPQNNTLDTIIQTLHQLSDEDKKQLEEEMIKLHSTEKNITFSQNSRDAKAFFALLFGCLAYYFGSKCIDYMHSTPKKTNKGFWKNGLGSYVNPWSYFNNEKME